MFDPEKYQQLVQQYNDRNPFMSNKEIAYQVLAEAITTGDIAIEERLVQDTLSEILGMSRSPVREALIQLEKEGFIEKNARGYYQVYRIRLRDYVEYCEMRLRMESYACELAARCISDEDLEKLNKNLEAYDEARITLEEALRLDEEFHNVIINASQNPYIIEFNEKYAKRKRHFARFLVHQKNLIYAKKKHQDIYNALANYDELRAKRAMESHLKNYIKNLYEIM